MNYNVSVGVKKCTQSCTKQVIVAGQIPMLPCSNNHEQLILLLAKTIIIFAYTSSKCTPTSLLKPQEEFPYTSGSQTFSDQGALSVSAPRPKEIPKTSVY